MSWLLLLLTSLATIRSENAGTEANLSPHLDPEGERASAADDADLQVGGGAQPRVRLQHLVRAPDLEAVDGAQHVSRAQTEDAEQRARRDAEESDADRLARF